MFTPSSVSNAWTLNGYPALPYISVSNHSNQSSPSQQGTPQGTPVATPVLSNTASMQTPPFISMQQIQQSVVHPSMLPPPPSPHSLGIRSGSLCSSQGQEFKGGVALVNVQGVLQNAFVMQQSQWRTSTTHSVSIHDALTEMKIQRQWDDITRGLCPVRLTGHVPMSPVVVRMVLHLGLVLND